MSAPDSAQEPPPQAQFVQMATGFTSTSLLHAVAQLRLACHLADRPKSPTRRSQ
jgi:hypothetical protein